MEPFAIWSLPLIEIEGISAGLDPFVLGVLLDILAVDAILVEKTPLLCMSLPGLDLVPAF